VLGLLDTYPVLANYIEKTADGALTISEAGWQEVSNQLLHQKNVLMQT
jgi:hypothetical protein